MEQSMTPLSRRERRSLSGPVPLGFTLVEVLVVIGIMVLLMALLLPMLARARRDAARSKIQADLHVIAEGLDAYKNDFGDYPRTGLGMRVGSTTALPVQGAAVLCWALLAPGPAIQDGAGQVNGVAPVNPDTGGLGFRIHPTSRGKVYGGYINPDHFRLGTVSGGSNQVNPFVASATNPWDDMQTVIADYYGNVILYFPANLSVSPQTDFVDSYKIGTLPPMAVYNFKDNSTPAGPVPAYLPATAIQDQSTLTAKVFAYRLGHLSAFSGTGTGPIAAGETPIVVPYLLWSAGPDGQFGPQLSTNKGKTLVTTGQDDDVVYPPDQLLTIPAGQQP